jgi:hypothetical protein
MKKALLVTMLLVSSVTFADTIKKDDYLICSKSDGGSHLGYVSALFKDGSVQISRPKYVSPYHEIFEGKVESVRVNAKTCKNLKFSDKESSNLNKKVV